MDALVLEFAENKRLLVPVLQSHKLTALAEHQSDETELDTLRGSRWRKSREKNKKRTQKKAGAAVARVVSGHRRWSALRTSPAGRWR